MIKRNIVLLHTTVIGKSLYDFEYFCLNSCFCVGAPEVSGVLHQLLNTIEIIMHSPHSLEGVNELAQPISGSRQMQWGVGSKMEDVFIILGF